MHINEQAGTRGPKRLPVRGRIRKKMIAQAPEIGAHFLSFNLPSKPICGGLSTVFSSLRDPASPLRRAAPG